MCQDNGSGSRPPAPESSDCGGQVISLCDHRTRKSIGAATTALVRHLASIHHRAIQVHNAVIERADVSVLTELCRTTGITLDLVDDDIRCAVLIPAALYGDTEREVFGKRPLQRRVEDDIDDEQAWEVLSRLNRSALSVWHCQTRLDGPGHRAKLLENTGETTDIAGIIGRPGPLDDVDGVYAGRRISFEGHDFIVFAHRLDERRERAVRELVAAREVDDGSEFWRRIELDVLRAIVDPADHHRWPGGEVEESVGCGSRRPASRSGTLLAIRRAVWRRFAEPDDGLTMHAHVAALIDDPAGLEALADEISKIRETVLLRRGGLRQHSAPIGLDEILSPFYIDEQGPYVPLDGLRDHPVRLLLLNKEVVDAGDIDTTASIGDVLRRTRMHSDQDWARAVDLAWMTYRTEQNLMATYGVYYGDEQGARDVEDEPRFMRLSSVLPNMRTLFDRRFLQTPLSALELPAPMHRRMMMGLEDSGVDADGYTIGDIERDERDLARLRNIGHKTCNAIRTALLEYGVRWRWDVGSR